jgi:beta-glucanase (GH16 family)
MRSPGILLFLAILAGVLGTSGCGKGSASKTANDGAARDTMLKEAPASSDGRATNDGISPATDSVARAEDTVPGSDTSVGRGDVAADAPMRTPDSATNTDAAGPGIDSGSNDPRDSRAPDQGGDGGPAKDALVPTDARAPADTSTVAPTFAAEMTKADQSRFYGRASNGGSYSFGVANASAADNNVAELVFKGNASLGPSDKLSPDFATEIGTNDATFRYGTYRARVQLARCSSSEELVNGIFTYFNDGNDHDGDGLVDNSEIDIEILCSDPSIISLTIWSEYTSDTAKKCVSRVIHTQTGAYEDTTNDQDSGHGSKPEFKLTGFPDPNAFYEMGFEWHADHIRYFIVVDGVELTLWIYTYAEYIPTLPAAFLFNVWHSTDWWSSRGTADYPASDATMRVDWFRYWKE